VLAIVLTAAVLGPQLGLARAVGAILFSVVVGLLMHVIFRKEEIEKANAQMAMPEPEVTRPLWQNALYFASMVGVLVFANWGKLAEATGVWHAIHSAKWYVTAAFSAAFAVILVLWFDLRWWRVVAAEERCPRPRVRLRRLVGAPDHRRGDPACRSADETDGGMP
jgi:hypothetical protein